MTGTHTLKKILPHSLGRLGSRRKSELLLAAVIVARSTSLIFTKLAMNSIAPFNLIALRFLTAFVIMLPILGRKLAKIKPREILCGAVLGTLFAGVLTMEFSGLKLTDAGTTSFIENSAMIFVPVILLVVFKKILGKNDIIRIVIALAGIAFLTVGAGGGTFNSGILYLLAAAVIYAVFLILTAKFAKQSEPLNIGLVQVGTVGIIALVLSLIFEQPRLPIGAHEWGMILALAAVCTGFGFTIQPLAQRGTTAERAGMLCAISPMSAAVLGVIFLNEGIRAAKVIGCAVILLSLLAEPLINRIRGIFCPAVPLPSDKNPETRVFPPEDFSNHNRSFPEC